MLCMEGQCASRGRSFTTANRGSVCHVHAVMVPWWLWCLVTCTRMLFVLQRHASFHPGLGTTDPKPPSPSPHPPPCKTKRKRNVVMEDGFQSPPTVVTVHRIAKSLVIARAQPTKTIMPPHIKVTTNGRTVVRYLAKITRRKAEENT